MFQTPFSDRIRNETGMATMAVGNIYEPDHVNSILMAGRADLVCLARPHLADPYWTLHAAAALGDRGVKWPDPYLPGRDQLYRLAERDATMAAESMMATLAASMRWSPAAAPASARRSRWRWPEPASTVTICGRREAALEAVAGESDRIYRHRAPTSPTKPAMAALYEKAEAARGPFDIVVANAGMADSAPAHRTTLDRLAAHARRQPDRRVPDREAGAGRHGGRARPAASSSSPRPPA